jgi:hypothetical protein
MHVIKMHVFNSVLCLFLGRRFLASPKTLMRFLLIVNCFLMVAFYGPSLCLLPGNRMGGNWGQSARSPFFFFLFLFDGPLRAILFTHLIDVVMVCWSARNTFADRRTTHKRWPQRPGAQIEFVLLSRFYVFWAMQDFFPLFSRSVRKHAILSFILLYMVSSFFSGHHGLRDLLFFEDWRRMCWDYYRKRRKISVLEQREPSVSRKIPAHARQSVTAIKDKKKKQIQEKP